MTRNTKIRLTVPIAGLFILQAVLPVVMVALLFFVKAEQKTFIRNNYDKGSLFQQISFNAQNTNAKFVGDNELLYKGVLYDVHSVVQNGSEYFVIALPDKRETAIYRLANVETGNTPAFQLNHINPVPFCLLYFEQQNEWHIYSRWVCNAFEEVHVHAVASAAQKILTPPPRYTA